MGVFAIAVIFSDVGNGAAFALVPHCHPRNNASLFLDFFDIITSLMLLLQGFMSGIVGGFGNLGGVLFALVLRFQPAPGKAFWIIGATCMAVNVILLPMSAP